jgi:hypothetical protein
MAVCRLGISFTTLFWTLFGLIGLTALEIQLRYIEGFGKLMFGLYNIAARILFLNMLIAMMSKSFNVTVVTAPLPWQPNVGQIAGFYVVADFRFQKCGMALCSVKCYWAQSQASKYGTLRSPNELITII